MQDVIPNESHLVVVDKCKTPDQTKGPQTVLRKTVTISTESVMPCARIVRVGGEMHAALCWCDGFLTL